MLSERPGITEERPPEGARGQLARYRVLGKPSVTNRSSRAAVRPPQRAPEPGKGGRGAAPAESSMKWLVIMRRLPPADEAS